MKWTVCRTAHAKVESFTKGRQRQPDTDFIRECGMEYRPEGARVAVGVRRAVAGVGLVDPLFIRAADRYPDDLDVLPLWDSMDFIALVLKLEEEIGIDIPDRVAERLVNVRAFTVRQMVENVHAYVLEAGSSPKS